MDSNINMPSGWTKVKLGDIFSFKGGGTPSKSEPSYWGGDICWASVKDIKGNYLYDTFDKITQTAIKNSNTNIAGPGDVILVTRINPGKAIIAKVETAINQDLKIVVPKIKTSPDFIKYLFDSLEKKCVELSSGTTVLGISINNLSEIQILLPPLAEQRRIVAKIEELFSSLDKGIESLKAAQQQLRIYRQSVLKWAFEGRLTHANINKGKLPGGWKWQRIGGIAESLDHLRKPVNKKERAKRIGPIPYYGANGRTGWIDDFLFDEPLVLVVEDETFTGRILPFSYKITGKSWVNNHAHILRPKKVIDIDFLNYQLWYYPFLQLTTGTTGRKKLTKNALMTAPILICSIEEQLSVVSEVESRLSICDKMEENINQGLHKAEVMRQSILKKAFGGKLVPQDLLTNQTTLT